MVKRLSFRPYLFTAFAIIVMMFCWESNRIQAALLDSSIPQDAIRIRILANSDSPQDQWIKREVQNEVVKEISTWVMDPAGLEEARSTIAANIPSLASLVEKVLVNNGFTMEYKVELGQVSFPAKQFGSKIYPAGEYEALRIVLGSGEGQNWWCVLFPPLCFVGMKSKTAEASAAEPVSSGTNPAVKAGEKPVAAKIKTASAASADKENGKISVSSVAKTSAAVTASGKAVANAAAAAAIEGSDAPKTEVKFFLWEVTKKITLKVKSLFA